MKSEDYKILIVDDEDDILEFVGYNLRKEGYQVYTATHGKESIKIAKEIAPHLIILDVMLPDMDGIETCAEIKKIPRLKNTVVVFLTARAEDYSQIAGLEAGGDDYICKPIKPRLLVSRVKAWLRRFSVETITPERLIFKDIIIDKEKYVVIKENVEISLARKEFELLLLLTSKPNKVFSRDEIFANVWGTSVIVGDRTIDVHIRKLREKLGIDIITTIKGVGYKFESNEIL
jgi:two-component system alkaline phosphatase synthesis response regulator PhoP